MDKLIKQKNKFDLEERTLVFSQAILMFCKTCGKDIVTQPLISQLVRSATSIGANYTEANGASSKKDFANKIYLCKKEAKETMYWIRLLGEYIEDMKKKNVLRDLWKESHELTLIFSKIAIKTK